MRENGEIAVVAGPWLRDQAQGHFLLNHNMNLVDQVRAAEQVMQNGRSDVVRQIAVNPEPLPASEIREFFEAKLTPQLRLV